MSALINPYILSSEPANYTTPGFPSLYWPFPWQGAQSRYLYETKDIWRFTLYWTLILYAGLHGGVSAYAMIVQWRNWKVIWIVPIVFGLISGLEATIAGSIVGGLLGAVYNAGYFRMSTWVPLVWAAINALVIVLSSFSIQGGL